MSIHWIIALGVIVVFIVAFLFFLLWCKHNYVNDGLITFIGFLVFLILTCISIGVASSIDEVNVKNNITNELKTEYNLNTDLHRYPANKNMKVTAANYNNGKMMGPYVANNGDTYLNIYLRNDNGTLKVYTCDSNDYYTEIKK